MAHLPQRKRHEIDSAGQVLHSAAVKLDNTGLDRVHVLSLHRQQDCRGSQTNDSRLLLVCNDTLLRSRLQEAT